MIFKSKHLNLKNLNISNHFYQTLFFQIVSNAVGLTTIICRIPEGPPNDN